MGDDNYTNGVAVQSTHPGYIVGAAVGAFVALSGVCYMLAERTPSKIDTEAIFHQRNEKELEAILMERVKLAQVQR